MVRGHEHLVARQGRAAVGPAACIPQDARRVRLAIRPQLPAGCRVDREDLIPPRDVHHAVDHEGRRLHPRRRRHVEDPRRRQILHGGEIDLREAAETAGRVAAVVRQPVRLRRDRFFPVDLAVLGQQVELPVGEQRGVELRFGPHDAGERPPAGQRDRDRTRVPARGAAASSATARGRRAHGGPAAAPAARHPREPARRHRRGRPRQDAQVGEDAGQFVGGQWNGGRAPVRQGQPRGDVRVCVVSNVGQNCRSGGARHRGPVTRRAPRLVDRCAERSLLTGGLRRGRRRLLRRRDPGQAGHEGDRHDGLAHHSVLRILASRLARRLCRRSVRHMGPSAPRSGSRAPTSGARHTRGSYRGGSA